MSKGLNKVMLIGNLGQDVELSAMPNGDAVCTLSIATTESWKDKNTGEKVDKTEWHRVVAFKRMAEVCGEFLRKGSKVYIEGSLRTKKWEKDGVTRYTTEIVARDMQMLDSRQQQGEQEQGRSNENGSQSSYTAPPAPDNFSDDIPF